ncbi:MAG: hypothetical protein QM811_25555 [Pirellulales bacterium]
MSAAIVASSNGATQSHNTLPADVRTKNARCPMPKLGSGLIECRPSSSSLIAFLCVVRNFSSVVHCWPSGWTYCRSSSQIGHDFGVALAGGYCVPQVMQIAAVSSAAAFGAAADAVSGANIPRATAVVVVRIKSLRVGPLM